MASGTIPQNIITVTKTFNFNGLTPDGWGWVAKTIDFSDSLPAGCTLVCASLRAGSYDYFMPYVNRETSAIETFLNSFNTNSRILVVRNKADGWGNTIYITALFKLP